jgi:membrane protease YdiL (CAAX protease family)
MAHIRKPGATLGACLAIAIEAGVLLGAAYAASGSLWLPIGIHAGWNFAEGPVFGMIVSGNTQRTAWISGALHGPEILTGGRFGPEASIFAALVCVFAAVTYLRRLARMSRKRG